MPRANEPNALHATAHDLRLSRHSACAAFAATTGRAGWSRRSTLSPSDFIWPLFVVDGQNKREPVASMPGVERLSVDLVAAAAEEAAKLGIPVIALFPYTDPALQDADGREATNRRQSRLPRRARDQEAPCRRSACCATWRSIPTPATAMTACWSTTMSPTTRRVEILVRQALVQAEAGCDIIAPSDMMDGRVGAIRAALEDERLQEHADHGLRGEICVARSTARSAMRSARRRR